jgi:hypothetical protein
MKVSANGLLCVGHFRRMQSAQTFEAPEIRWTYLLAASHVSGTCTLDAFR